MAIFKNRLSINNSIILLNIIIFIFGSYLLTIGYPYYEDIILFNQNDKYYKFHQWITYMFAHANFSHLFFNMFVLFLFGEKLEEYFTKGKYLLFFILSGLGSVIFYVWLTPTFSSILGASGAVFGVIAVYALLHPNEKINLLFFLPVKIKYLASIYILSEVFLSIIANDNVAHIAHVGGALSGILFFLTDRFFKKRAT